jgi:hypothetical protein
MSTNANETKKTKAAKNEAIYRVPPGAEKKEYEFADTIRQYWHDFGYNVDVQVEYIDHGTWGYHVVRSNLIDGLPPDLHSAMPVSDAISSKNGQMPGRYYPAPKVWESGDESAPPIRVTVHGAGR